MTGLSIICITVRSPVTENHRGTNLIYMRQMFNASYISLYKICNTSNYNHYMIYKYESTRKDVNQACIIPVYFEFLDKYILTI